MNAKLVLMVFLVSIVTGCTAAGAKYNQKAFEAEGSSQVIFFRPNNFMGGGLRFAIYEGEELLYKIKNGQYIVHDTDVGEKQFKVNSLDNDRPLTLKIEPGERYYVRVGMQTGAIVNTLYLTRVYEEEALLELDACCKSGD